MEISHVIVLALVQGISEFLPISSSAHLILVPKLLGWPDQGLAFDVAVHVGTLSAILFYFKDTIFKLLRDFFASIAQRKMVGDSLLIWCVGFATIPVGIFGLLFNNVIEEYARSGVVIAVEAATGYEWYKFADAVYGMNSFGASGKANELFDHFGFTPQKLANFASELI